MSVQSVSQKSFDQLHPGRRSSWAEQDVEWFIERSRTLIAYIAGTIGAGDWRVVIEGRDEHGEFYGIESVDGLSSQEDARAVIEKRINDLMATGRKGFPALFRRAFGLNQCPKLACFRAREIVACGAMVGRVAVVRLRSTSAVGSRGSNRAATAERGPRLAFAF